MHAPLCGAEAALSPSPGSPTAGAASDSKSRVNEPELAPLRNALARQPAEAEDEDGSLAALRQMPLLRVAEAAAA